MSQEIKNVLVIGASGNLGTAVLKTLIASQKFTISVLTRLGSTAVFPEGVQVFKSTYDNISTLTPAFTSQDAVICTLNHYAWSSQFLFIDLSLAAGVQRFIPSEFGTDTLNKKVAELWGSAGAVKKEVLDYLKKNEGKGMTWTGIATGTFFEWGLQNSLYGFSLPHHTAILYTDALHTPFSHTTTPQLTRAILALLLHPSSTSITNTLLKIHSFPATQHQILTALQEATALQETTTLTLQKTTTLTTLKPTTQKNWTLTQSTLATTEKLGQEKLAQGDFSGAALLLHVNFMGTGFGSDFEGEGVLGNEVLGLEGEDLGKVVRGLVQSGY